MTTMDAAGYEELLQFLYMLPVGVMRFGPDGAIDLINPMVSQLLLPLLPTPQLTNVFDMFAELCPELRTKVAGFTANAGMILDRRRIDAEVMRQPVTLALTVRRVSAEAYMGVLADISRLAQMLAFAFASADLLVDVDGENTITWAGGTLKSPGLGRTDALIGRELSSLIAPRDRGALERAMFLAGHGRMAPLTLRLADDAETPCVVSGLATDGPVQRYFVTIGQPPAADSRHETVPAQAKEFRREAERALRDGQAKSLGLVSVAGWEAATRALDVGHLHALKAEIGRLLGGEAGARAVVGEVAEGRFGVMCRNDAAAGRLGEAVRGALDAVLPGARVRVAAERVALDGDDLSCADAAQALRLVLARFGGGQTPQAAGLRAVLEHARQEARALRAVLESGRIGLAFQPVVSLRGRALHHYEALLRVAPDAAGHVVNTQEFVVMAEAVGLSSLLDSRVLRMTMAALRRHDVSIAANMSGASAAEASFPDWLLREAGELVGGRLLVEVTETAEITDLAAAAANIARIRAAGIPVCLDDFGAGNASFRYLRALPVDFVKIDGAYVRGALRAPEGRAFLSAMRELAGSAGAATVAEMVETEEQAALLADLGVEYGQGWLFGRPGRLPEAQVAAAPLKRWRY